MEIVFDVPDHDVERVIAVVAEDGFDVQLPATIVSVETWEAGGEDDGLPGVREPRHPHPRNDQPAFQERLIGSAADSVSSRSRHRSSRD